MTGVQLCFGIFGLQSCVKTFLLNFENHSKHDTLPTLKLHFGTIFQPAIPETWQECFYIILYNEETTTIFQAQDWTIIVPSQANLRSGRVRRRALFVTGTAFNRSPCEVFKAKGR